MVLIWPDTVLGEAPRALVWYMSTELDKRDTSFKLDCANAAIDALIDKISQQKIIHDNLIAAIRAALSELGVPSGDYPANVANAVEHLAEALKYL
jgi:hypothetical protein